MTAPVRGNWPSRCWLTTSAMTKALALSAAFTRDLVASLDNAWCLTSTDIDEVLASRFGNPP